MPEEKGNSEVVDVVQGQETEVPAEPKRESGIFRRKKRQLDPEDLAILEAQQAQEEADLEWQLNGGSYLNAEEQAEAKAKLPKEKTSKGKKRRRKKETIAPPAPGPDGLPPWESRLMRSGRGWAIVACTSNVVTILNNHDVWKDVLAYNEFTSTVVKQRAPKWHREDRPEKCEPGEWSDLDTSLLASWAERKYDMVFKSQAPINAAVEIAARKRTIHPVRDYLESLEWDEVERLDDFMIRLAGVEDIEFNRVASRKWLISAVARAYEPGCKADHVLILYGAQGVGKSTFFRTLAGEEWFLETNMELGSKDAQQALRGVWMAELPELGSLARSEISHIKSFITEQISTFRPSYGRYTIKAPRQCVFAGTTNEDHFLKDTTGNRRFWVIPVGKIRLKELAKEREQLLAEAVYRYKIGERWHIEDKKLLAQAAEAAEQHRQLDPWEHIIGRALERSRRAKIEGVTTHQILTEVIGLDVSKLSRVDEIRVGAILRSLKWTIVKRVGSTTRRYFPSNS